MLTRFNIWNILGAIVLASSLFTAFAFTNPDFAALATGSEYGIPTPDPTMLREPSAVAFDAIIPFLCFSWLAVIFSRRYYLKQRDASAPFGLREALLVVFGSWICFIWLTRVLILSDKPFPIVGNLCIGILAATILVYGTKALVLFFKHPRIGAFFQHHRQLIFIIAAAFFIRSLLILAFPFLITTGDGGDGFYFYQRIWMMALGNYQGNLTFVTGYPFFMSFFGIFFVKLVKSLPVLLCQHLISIVTVIFTYHITWLHTKNKLASLLVGLIAAFSLTDALWAHRSRPVFFGTFLSMAGMWSFSVWLKKDRNFSWLIVTGILLAAATLCRNFPIVYLGSFSLVILFLRDAFPQKVRHLAALFVPFFICFYAYLAVVQYRSTEMFTMRGMGLGVFFLAQISYKGDPIKVPFDREAGEYTNRMIAYTNSIRNELPHMPMTYWTANLFNKKGPLAPVHLTQKLKASVANHSKYDLPPLEKERDVVFVDKVELAYHLGVPETNDLQNGYVFEQFVGAPEKYAWIVWGRILDSFRIHENNYVYRHHYYPRYNTVEPQGSGFLGFYRVQWPSPYDGDIHIPFSNLAIMQLIEWLYEYVLYGWWVYLLTLLAVTRDIFRRTDFGQLAMICLLMIAAFIVAHAFIAAPYARHMVMLEPLYTILFGLALCQAIHLISYLRSVYRS